MTEPRNVTPGSEQPSYEHGSYNGPTYQGEWSTVTWTKVAGRNIPWIGVLLVLVGIALLIGTVFPALSTSTLALLAIGIAFLVGWVFGRSYVSMVFGLLTLALGVAELIEDAALLGPASQDVPGLWSAALAIAFLLIWVIGYVSGRRNTWPLWGLAIFGLIGFAELSRLFTNLPLDLLWPVLIIGAGVVVLLGATRRTA